LYGVTIGCQPASCGDPMSMAGEDPVFGGTDRLARLWPEMIGKEIDMTKAREFADYELDKPWLMSAAELRMIFDWERL
jgi:hypothetical protein